MKFRIWPAMFEERIRRARRSIDELSSPLPLVKLASRRSVPAWSVRLLLMIFGVLTILALQPGSPPTVILSIFLLGVAFRPGVFSGCLYCVALAVIWLVLATPVISLPTVLLLGFGPAIPALATVIAQVPVRARIECRVFTPSLFRFMIIEVITQPVVLLAGSLQNLKLGLLPVAIAGAVIVAVATWLLLPRLSK